MTTGYSASVETQWCRRIRRRVHDHAVNPLLRPPTDAEQHMLETICKGRELAGSPNYELANTGSGTVVPRRVGKQSQWPIFQYVEASLYQQYGLDARSVILECPTVRLGVGPSKYGWIRFQNLQPDDPIALTVAGMTRLRALSAEVAVFLDALASVVRRERQFTPSPTTVQNVSVRSSQVRERLGIVDLGGRRARQHP